MHTASEQITEEVTSWPGVEAGIGARGEYGFTVGRRQIGHLHGDHAAHFGFPRTVWEELMAEGRVVKHPIDKPGWAARRIEDEADVRRLARLRGAGDARAGCGLPLVPQPPPRGDVRRRRRRRAAVPARGRSHRGRAEAARARD